MGTEDDFCRLVGGEIAANRNRVKSVLREVAEGAMFEAERARGMRRAEDVAGVVRTAVRAAYELARTTTLGVGAVGRGEELLFHLDEARQSLDGAAAYDSELEWIPELEGDARRAFERISAAFRRADEAIVAEDTVALVEAVGRIARRVRRAMRAFRVPIAADCRDYFDRVELSASHELTAAAMVAGAQAVMLDDGIAEAAGAEGERTAAG